MMIRACEVGRLVTVAMQLECVARQTGDPARRIFPDTRSAILWLDDVLDAQERARLRTFVLSPTTVST